MLDNFRAGIFSLHCRILALGKLEKPGDGQIRTQPERRNLPKVPLFHLQFRERCQTALTCRANSLGVRKRSALVLDIAFREDESRVGKGNVPQNLAVLRRMALNMLNRGKTSEGGTKAKRLRAGWDHDYLLKVLSA